MSASASSSGSQACGSGATSSVSAQKYSASAYPHYHSASAHPHVPTAKPWNERMILNKYFQSLGGAGSTEPSLVFSQPKEDVGLKQKLIALRMVAEDIMNSDQPSAEVLAWTLNRIEEVNGQIKKVTDDDTHVVNAKLLAERVIIKFLKYRTSRFTDSYKSDFYDGSTCVNQPIKFDPIFRIAVQNMAKRCGLDGDPILSNLHVGLSSLKRFKDFISIQ